MRGNIHQDVDLWQGAIVKGNEYKGEAKAPCPVYNQETGRNKNKLQYLTYTISNKKFNKLSKYIKTNYGINLREEKKTMLIGRLRNVLQQNNFNKFSEYYDYIVSDKSGAAATTLINRISTNHTYFMREAEHFYFFQNTVLPYLKDKVNNRDLRIWSAGCSTGEEPYTLAMIIEEFFGTEKSQWDTRILATDISDKVLDTAKEGVYDNERITTLPSKWKLKYFKQVDGKSSAIIDRMRNEVIFRRLNLMDEKFPFKNKFHVIFCRNVMIYFDAQTKKKLIDKFYDLLEYGGYLFIGHSESISRSETRYKYIKPAVYRKE
jgi:chemotaxis protein methyltransferase CheR